MLVDGRNKIFFFLKRLAQSKPFAFISSTSLNLLPSISLILNPEVTKISTSITSDSYNCENNQNINIDNIDNIDINNRHMFKSLLNDKLNQSSIDSTINSTTTTTTRSFINHSSITFRSICKFPQFLFLILIIHLLILIPLLSSLSSSSSSSSLLLFLLSSLIKSSLLILFIHCIILIIINKYLLFNFCFIHLKTSLSSLLLLLLSLLHHYCHINYSLVNQSQKGKQYNLVKIKKIESSSIFAFSRKKILKIIIIAMVSLTIFRNDHSNSYHNNKLLSTYLLKNRIFVNAEFNNNNNNNELDNKNNDNSKHSKFVDNISTKTTTTTTMSNNQYNNKDFQHVEQQFLRMMGIPVKPNPKKHHKVPEYLIDLYRWFKENYDQSAHIDTIDDDFDNVQIDDNNNDNAKKMQSNSLIGLTTDDLYDIQNLNNNNDDNNHYRLVRKRRSTQLSRVTLQGPSTTVISHKTSLLHHMKSTKDHHSPESLSNNNFINKKPQQQTHLTQLSFKIQLPSDEILTGAELRLYRHSIQKESSSSSSSSSSKFIDNDLITSKNTLSLYNNFWPSTYQSSSLKSNFDNSHLITTKVNNSLSSSYHYSSSSSFASFSSSSNKNSGEEYSSSSSSNINNDHKYLQRVNIYHLLRPLSYNEQQNLQKQTINEILLKRSKLIDTQVIDIRDSGWLSFDVYPAVEWWAKHPSENYGLLITIKNFNGRNESSYSHLFVLNPTIDNNGQVQSATSHHEEQQHQKLNIDDNHEWHELQPLIITFSNDKKLHQHYLSNKDKLLNRSKRDRKRGVMVNGQSNINSNNNNNNYGQQKLKKKNHKNSFKRRNYCHRYRMYFDFKDVGWMDWIVAPPGYHAYYCKGECSYPMSQKMNKTNHAIIQSLINSVNPAVVPEPCCIPTDLSSVTLLYLDHNEKVVLKNYPNMVVEGCGCN